MIGILDSGIGGLSVMKEVARIMPEQDIFYLADTLHCPYGGRSKDDIINLSEQCVSFLINQGANIIVLACNTITAAAADTLRSNHPEIPFVGMEPAVKPAAQTSHSKVVGVLATQATLNGELYSHTKGKYASDVDVLEVAGQGLVELVEQGLEDSDQAEKLLREYIEPMLDKGADTLVLGCTHFPFLRNRIERIAQGRLRLIDPAPAVARHTKELIEQYGLEIAKDHEGKYVFKSTLSDQATDFLINVANKVVKSLKYEWWND